MVLKVILIFCFFAFSLCLNDQKNFRIAQAAKIAYQTRENIQKWQCRQCDPMTTDIIFVSNEQAKIQGFIGYSHYDKSIIISIRGSSHFQNWLYNSQTKLISYPICGGCKVHQGFYKLSQLLFNPIKLAIEQIRKKYEKVEEKLSITLTGHSLGGALSTLIGSRLIYNQGITAILMTFGSPRIGNKAFAEYVSSKFKESYRVVYGRDSIPHLPLRLKGYVHADTEIWYEFADQKKQCLGDKSRQCSNSVSIFLLKSSHHHIDNYVDLFNKASKNKFNISSLKSSLLDRKLTGVISEVIKRQQISLRNQTQGLQGYQLIKILSKDSQLQDFIQKYDG